MAPSKYFSSCYSKSLFFIFLVFQNIRLVLDLMSGISRSLSTFHQSRKLFGRGIDNRTVLYYLWGGGGGYLQANKHISHHNSTVAFGKHSKRRFTCKVNSY